MEVLIAKKDDLKDIFALIKDAKNILKQNGIPQWQKDYPTIHDLEKDIQNQTMMILKRKKETIACANLSLEPDPFYQEIEGNWLQEDLYASLHRIAVKSNVHGQGYGQKFIAELEKIAKEKGAYSIRIDTHPLNQSMKTLLDKRHYHYCGLVVVQDKTSRIAYEKLLSQ